MEKQKKTSLELVELIETAAPDVDAFIVVCADKTFGWEAVVVNGDPARYAHNVQRVDQVVRELRTQYDLQATPNQATVPTERPLSSGFSDTPASSSDTPPREVNEFIRFEADPKIQEMAEDSSRNLIDWARDQFGIHLDWSDDSIREIERIAGLAHEHYLEKAPPFEHIKPYCTMIGSYIGEVFRRNHGAEWGIVTLNGASFPGMKHKPDGHFWPHGKAQQRILAGPEDNLWFYYRVLVSKVEPEAGQG